MWVGVWVLWDVKDDVGLAMFFSGRMLPFLRHAKWAGDLTCHRDDHVLIGDLKLYIFP